MRVVLFFVVFLFTATAWCQDVTTFGGGGTILGDGGPATQAKILNPNGGSFDKYGNYYVASNNGHRIRKIDTNGIITTVAGIGTPGFSGDNGLATLAQLKNPEQAIVDSNGNIYIADAGNSRIRKVNGQTGIITTVAGSTTSGFGGDNGLATSAFLADPLDICFDKLGNLYIADYGNARVRKVNLISGLITTVAGNGIAGYSGDGSKADTSAIGGIEGICADISGNIYLASISESRVLKINPSGILSTSAGNGIGTLYNGDEIPGPTAQINPVKVCVDRDGNVYVAERYNFRVRKIDLSGIIHTIAGNGIPGFSGDGGPADSAEFDYPAGVTVDYCQNLYIADVGNNRIRKVTFHPNCFPESVNEVAGIDEVSIYPNPAKEQLTVAAGSGLDEVLVLNAVGQILIAQKNYKSNKAIVNVNGLAAGVYFVKVSGRNGAVVTKRFVKE